MASESCSLDIDPEKTMTMIEDVLDYSDSVDNEQLVSIKEMFYIHLDAPAVKIFHMNFNVIMDMS